MLRNCLAANVRNSRLWFDWTRSLSNQLNCQSWILISRDQMPASAQRPRTLQKSSGWCVPISGLDGSDGKRTVGRQAAICAWPSRARKSGSRCLHMNSFPLRTEWHASEEMSDHIIWSRRRAPITTRVVRSATRTASFSTGDPISAECIDRKMA